jgi:putative DNA primase/helicase
MSAEYPGLRRLDEARRPRQRTPAPAAEPVPPEFSDDALALRFADEHAAGLQYVNAWGAWLRWESGRWREEKTRAAFDLARGICRIAAAKCDKPKVAAAVASAKTVAAVERLAQSDRRIAATTDQWDADHWLLNTPSGVVDLRTGELGPHRADHFMTKMAAAGPGGTCPTWTVFLSRICAGDIELIAYLQRLAGYCLTGSTAEQIMAFGHGTGANGKSVFVSTLTGILGDYARTAPIETFTASTSERHPTELAALRGARLVVATETEEGRRWAESKLKALTGGDKIAARFMRQDFFEFTPVFKLLIVGNHKPSLRTVDEAIRRRLHIIPFGVTIPPEERDPELTERLKAEWPGILRWAIDGCLRWQDRRLEVPAVVRTATDQYLEAEDACGEWLAERTAPASMSHETTADLFASWKAWADKAGEHVGTQKRFSQNLASRGYMPKRQGGTGRAGFAGLRLVRADYTDDPRYGT